MLHFPVLDDRLQSIAPAQEGTLEWIDENGRSAELWSNNLRQSSLTDWLGRTSGQNLFWITGKPGSGRSTLMKTLLRNPRLFPDLEAWSSASPRITAGYFFWSSGAELQMSYSGLLRSLIWEALQDMIYGPLQKCPSIVQWLFADRRQQFKSYGGGHHQFHSGELRRAFDLMATDVSKKFLFLIDGLDELERYPEAVVELLTSSAKRSNVKIITSSRPLPGFQHVFGGRPVLSMEPMIKNDIQAVISGLFNPDNKQTDNTLESAIINDIAQRSGDTLLWATLATHFILRSLKDADDFSDMTSHQQRASPSQTTWTPNPASRLQSALSKAQNLGRTEPSHNRDLQSARIPSTKLPHHVRNHTERIPTVSHRWRGQRRRIADDQLHHSRLKVNFAHRTIKYFVESGPVREQIRQATGYDSFNSNEHWANASLWTVKTLEPNPWVSEYNKFELWNDMASCIEYSLRLEEADKQVRVTYLVEVGRAGVTERLRYISINATDLPEAPPLESFLDIAVWLNLKLDM